ncbi:hypothetical protein MMC07_009070 [Pseudocyphellaria aurata]|nr:hypothetical protein [Pseudocyphellaria aurata]
MAATDQTPSTFSSPSSEDSLNITLTHHGKPYTFTLPQSSTLMDLATSIHSTLSIPPSNQKLLITPKTGLLKPPFPPLSLSTLVHKKILLLAPTATELTALSQPSPRTSSIPKKSVVPARHIDQQKIKDRATYTFQTLLPLQHLPNPSRSLAFLERLRSDPGIQAAMSKHKFSVGVLTEMDPAQHTTHESRTLGLNRNRGEVIELRLRTDAYDGYRDYKIIRKTLCHELAHNVFGEHDRNFWDLTGQIEREVERGDWKNGGHALTEEVFYDPGEEEVDGGGWTGGEFILGGEGRSGKGLNRREAMAKAAEERIRRQKEAGSGGSGGG